MNRKRLLHINTCSEDIKEERRSNSTNSVNSTHGSSVNKEDEVSSSGGEEQGNYYKFLENLHIGHLIHESVYESAAKLLFLSVKWARSVPSFLSVSFLFF
jgi:hypothetical protein